MNNVNAYPTYKQSGVQWLGDIPSHWDIIKNKFILNFSKGLTITKENLVDDGIPCVNYGEIHSKYGFEVIPEKHYLKCVPETYLENAQNALLKNGDFVFADTSEDVKGSGNFTYLNSDTPTFAGYHTIIARLKSDDVCSRFLAYVFSSEMHRNQVRSIVKGVKVFSITQAFLKNTYVYFPPPNEQTTIAHYLDRETAKIDALLQKQAELLAKLSEKRTALITHAVTKGLNPNVPMKNSGVAWLGDIPSHWEVKRLKKSILNHQNGIWGNEPKFDDNDVYCLRVADFNRHNLTISENNLTIRNIELKDYESRKLSQGDLLLEKSGGGEKQPVGFVVLNTFNGKAVCSNFIAKIELANDMNPNYWVYMHSVLYSARVNIRSIKQSTGIQNLDATLYFDELVCYPSYIEQTAIAHYLDRETAKIDALCDKIRELSERLTEYRTTLISDAVTGKIKVIP